MPIMESPKQTLGDALTGSESPPTNTPANHPNPTQNAREEATASSKGERSPLNGKRALTGKITKLLMEQIRIHGAVDPSTIENDVGMTEEEVRARSPKLDALLTDLLPEEYDYQDVDLADMATVRLLKIWRFSDPAIGVILLKRRSREEVDGSTKRLKMARWWDYLPRTIINTDLTDVEPFDLNLMTAYMEDAREHGGRPSVGIDSLREVYHALTLMDREEITVKEIIESGFIVWTTDKSSSQARRVRRALNLLVRAGALTATQSPGLPTTYTDNGLGDLSIPPLHIGH